MPTAYLDPVFIFKIVRVLQENQFDALLPHFEDKRARSDRVAAEIGSVKFHGFMGYNGTVLHAEKAQEWRKRPCQPDDEG